MAKHVDRDFLPVVPVQKLGHFLGEVVGQDYSVGHGIGRVQPAIVRPYVKVGIGIAPTAAVHPAEQMIDVLPDRLRSKSFLCATARWKIVFGSMPLPEAKAMKITRSRSFCAVSIAWSCASFGPSASCLRKPIRVFRSIRKSS